jgi:Protein of unknown function (DUF3194).
MSTEPDEETVVTTAAAAAEGFILSRFANSAITDLDITVTFEDSVLDLDIYLNTADDAAADPDTVANEAIAAAEDAVDELFA